MPHPDETLTARAAKARQDLRDALHLVQRAGCWMRIGSADCIPLTDDDRNDHADALNALDQLVRALSANGHPSVIEARPPDHVHTWKVA